MLTPEPKNREIGVNIVEETPGHPETTTPDNNPGVRHIPYLLTH